MFLSVARNLRFAGRNLLRRPSYAIAVVLTLAVGIAGTVVVMSLASGALFRPPPFHRPDRLVLVYRTATIGPAEPRLTRWSHPRFDALRRSAQSFERLATFGPAELNLAGGGEPERVTAELVSSDYLAMLGIAPQLGTGFADDPGSANAPPAVVIGHRLWLNRFGADQSVLGRPIQLNGELLVVAGVMPAGFRGLTGRADLWVPHTMAPRLTYRDYLSTDQNFISVAGRLRDGVSVDRARAELEVLGREIAAAIPDTDDEAERWGATAIPLTAARIDGGQRQTLQFLLAAVACFLLLACVNVAALGLAAVVARRQEMTVRLALGAGRGRLVGQLLTESALLGGVAGGLGLLAASFIVRAVRLPSARPGPGNMWGAVGDFATAVIDWRVVGVAVVVSIAAIVLSGVVPALTAGRTDLAVELKDRTTTVAGRRSRIHAGLVSAEVALALALAVGGALLFESLRRFQTRPLGIAPEHVLSFRIAPSDVHYPADRAPDVLDRVLDAVRAVPGVRAATVDACPPLGLSCASSSLIMAGNPLVSPTNPPPISRHYVGPDHFATLGIPLLSGRAFTDQDRADRPGVAIINQTAARRFFADRDPIGQRIWFGGGSRWNSPDSSVTIVGVVGDVPYGSLERAQVPSVYTPYRQFTYAFRTVMVKVDGDPSDYQRPIRAAVATVDQLPIFDAAPLTEQLGGVWATTRFVARLMAVFALVALGLAAGGVYGIVSHSVNRRTHEMGVRSALGASSRDLVRLVVAEGLTLTGWGIALGLLAAIGLGRLMKSLLFGVTPGDPAILALLSLALLLTAAGASYFPARRAARADPVRSLRLD